MSDRVSISLLIGWFIILFIFIFNGWTPSKEAQLADGVMMDKTENQGASELNTEDTESSNCKAFELKKYYKQTGISLRASERRNAVSQ